MPTVRQELRHAPFELWLELIDTGQSVVVPDGGDPFLIGRERTAGLVIDDPSCSREHAAIRRDGEAIWLEPQSLRQPTFVNGTPHDRPVRLASGDILRLGNVEVRVRIGLVGASSNLSAASDRPADGKASSSPVASRSGDTQLGGVGDSDAAASLIARHTGPIVVRDSLLVGRQGGPADAGLSLDHPTISLRHAVVLSDAGGLTVRDLGSTNGTFVNDARVRTSQVLRDGDKLRVGPFAFDVTGNTLVPCDVGPVTQLGAAGVTVTVDGGGTQKSLLRDVSLGIRASEFVAVIGPSGCGKSTLIRILSGRAAPTGGCVSWKGTDLHRSFDALKAEIAFVPQRETLPELLTVRQALTYTARLRLPADTSRAEQEAIVDDVIATVGLNEQAELPIARLSGGQRKRTGLANELLVRPSLMFLDEVTSGLDEATDREMMVLFRALADRGIAVVCVTHTLANVEGTCDSLLIMARGGTVAYHGPVADVRSYFDVHALGDIYGELDRHPPATWRERNDRASPYRGRVRHLDGRGHVEPNASAMHRARPARDRRMPFAQLAVLLERYLEVTFADRRTLVMAGLQGVVIAAFLRLVFGGAAPEPPRELLLVFLLGVSAFWFGCNNAAKEIVKERPLFHLERDVNLRLPSYLLSKILILGFIGVVQVALLFAGVRLLGPGFSHPGGVLGIMTLTVLAGTTCGMLISAAAASEDQAITIVPIALIPQLLLSEAIVSPLTDVARLVAKLGITTYWMYRAEREVLDVPGFDGSSGAAMLAGHALTYAGGTLLVLWWRERMRRR